MSSVHDQADAQRGLHRNRKSHVDRIREHLLDQTGKIELTEAEQKTWERLQKAWGMKLKGYSHSEIAQLLTTEYGITARQGNFDVMATIALYGDTTRSTKEGMRAMLSEMAFKLWRKALLQDDLKAMDAAISKLTKIHGVDRDDPEVIDFSKLEQHLYAMVLDQQSQDALKVLTAGKGSINLSQALDKLHANAEEVESEDVTNA